MGCTCHIRGIALNSPITPGALSQLQRKENKRRKQKEENQKENGKKKRKIYIADRCKQQ
jgi:hypothetical protein